MSIYSDNTLAGQTLERTPWRGEECYITFYKESDYTAGKLRSQMTPVADYLFVQGVTITHNLAEHPAVQALNSSWKNLNSPAYEESTLAVSSFYVQEGDRMAWLSSGPLLAFIDFIDAEKFKKSKGDVLDANLNMVQTIVMRNLRCTSRNISSNVNGITTYQLSFTGGSVTTLPLGTMDL